MREKPNLLLIVLDQLRYDCIGCANKYPVKTPNIDKLAGEGVFFDHAFTPCPVCAPARQAMLTGRMPDSFGALFNYDFIPVPSLCPERTYWPMLLLNAGYKTAFVGKWHASRSYSAGDFGYEQVFNLSDYYAFVKEKYPEVRYKNGWFGEENPVPFEDAQPHFMAEKACRFIEEYAASGFPWHLRLDLTVPHLPCRPSRPFSRMYSPSDTVEWDGFGDTLENKPYIQKQQVMNWRLENKSWKEWSVTVSLYYAMISQIDDAIGKIISVVEKTGESENTAVIFTSDHGDLCGSHGMIDKHYVLYDDVLRVPLIIKWPEKCKPSRRHEFVSNCLDLPATIGDICGIPVDSGHGKSLMPLLTGQEQQRAAYAVSSSNGQQFGLYTQRSIRTTEWKYIWNLTDRDELYNIKEDCGEKINLAGRKEYEDALKNLRKLLYDELMRLEDPFVKSGWLNRQLLENVKY